MDPGALDTPVELVGFIANGRDAMGTPVQSEDWPRIVWAKVVYPGGREFFGADGQQTEKKVIFRIWRIDGIDTSIVIRLNGVDHDIQDVRPFADIIELHTVARDR